MSNLVICFRKKKIPTAPWDIGRKPFQGAPRPALTFVSMDNKLFPVRASYISTPPSQRSLRRTHRELDVAPNPT